MSIVLRSSALWLIGIAGLLLAGDRGYRDPANFPYRNQTGCAAVNAGAFDLTFKIAPSGLIAGLKGSGFVKGFAEGDVLVFEEKAAAGSVPLVHQLSVAAHDRGGLNQTSKVFVLPEHVVPARDDWSEKHAKFTIPASGTGWHLFTASSGEGEGEYTLTVRCEHGLIS